MRFQGNGPIGLKLGIHVPQDLYYNSQYRFWDIWGFGHFTGRDMCRDGHFWSILGDFNKKQPSRHMSGPVKFPKHQISKNLQVTIVVGVLRYIYTNFQANWTISLETHKLSAYKFFLIHFLKSQKITVFGQKKGAFFGRFCRNFGN